MTQSSQNSRFWKGVGLAFLASFMWALLAFILKTAFVFSDPQTLSWFRLLSSSLMLMVWLYIKKPGWAHELKKISFWMIPAALALSFNYVGYATGLKLTQPGNAQMLIQLGPILITLLTFATGREKIHFWHIFGLAIALLGFAVFYRHQLIRFSASNPQQSLGNLWVLSAACAWTFWAYIQKGETQKGRSTWALNFYVWGISAATLFPMADIASLGNVNFNQLLILLFLGLNTLIAYGAYTTAFELAPTAVVNLIVSTNPLIVFALSPGQTDLTDWLAGLIVFLGVTLSLYPQLKSALKKRFVALSAKFN